MQKLTELLECFVPTVFCFTEPDYNPCRLAVDLGHELNLLCFLGDIPLVDADGINPENAL